MMYKRQPRWRKPLIALGMALYTFCAGVGFGWLLNWLIGLIG